MNCLIRSQCLNYLKYNGGVIVKRQVPLAYNVHRQLSVETPTTFKQSGKGGPSVMTKSLLYGTGVGLVFGTLISVYDNYFKKTGSSEYKQYDPQILDTFPAVNITKRFVNPNDKSNLDIVLFQFQTCPFCCKVRAFLDYMGISYSVVEVDAVLRQDIKWSRTKKVPTVLIKTKDDKWVQFNDSSAIISVLASYLKSQDPDILDLAKIYLTFSYTDENNKQKEDVLNKYFIMHKDDKSSKSKELQKEESSERNWRLWVDNHLVHLISPNCYRTMPEALETFRWFSDAGQWDKYFPSWERHLMVYVGAVAMWIIAKMLKKRHGITDDERSHIYNALDKWTDEIKKRGNGDFYGGKQPNLADLAVFGVLSSMEGCQAFKDCLENSNIAPWFYKVKDTVVQNRGQLL